MPLDAMTLVGKVMDCAAQKCGQLGPASAAALNEEQKTEVLIDTLASQLLRLFDLDGATAQTGQLPPADLEQICADQIRRNQTLARALERATAGASCDRATSAAAEGRQVGGAPRRRRSTGWCGRSCGA